MIHLRRLLAFSLVVASLPQGAWARTVRIPAGTTVVLRTTTDVVAVSSTTATVGDIVPLATVERVQIDGKTVIDAGAAGQAEVTFVQRRTMFGVPAKISIVAKSVNAVDNSAIPVGNGKTVEGANRMICSIIGTILCLLPALIVGGEVSLPAGSVINAVTTSPIDVHVP